MKGQECPNICSRGVRVHVLIKWILVCGLLLGRRRRSASAATQQRRYRAGLLSPFLRALLPQDVPGIKKLLPGAWRQRYTEFDNIYK